SRANINFSKGAKRTLELAFHAAQSLDHKYIGTEHLLLGLYDLDGGEAALWLVERGITVEKVTGEVRARAGTPRKDETDANRQHVVSVRLDDDALRKIDALIKADLFKSRSEAAYFLIRKGLEAQATIVDLVGERLGEIKRIQEELKRLFDEHTGS
ncbi:MAG TPA: Clp protease N-terminal domain-containing protein, partial [Limnochordia bacterium]|nr:Clp protease N-terminal domain-containing protein [Limnochordia bacterium]